MKKLYQWNLKVFHPKSLLLLLLLIIVFLQKLNSTKVQYFFFIFKGNCLKLNATFTLRNANLFVVVVVVDELDRCSQELFSDFTLKHCLFGGVKLAANADPDKYVYSGYGIGLDSSSEGT